MTLSNVQKVILHHVHRELSVFVHFTRRDWSASFAPSLIFSLCALQSLPSPTLTISRYSFLLLWTALYIYIFDLLNQIIGVTEDKINKPDRPIPSGKVAVREAKIRCAIVLMAFLSLTLFQPSLLPETLCWVLDTAFLCLTPAGHHWIGKDCIGMTLGSWSLFSASWKIIAPATPQSRRWAIVVALWVGFVMNLQDLRDAEGDALIGRKTLPLALGDTVARSVITFGFIPLGFGMLWLGNVVQTAPAIIGAANVLLGWRVMQSKKGARYDHTTYMIFTYTLCLILVCIAIWGPALNSFVEL